MSTIIKILYWAPRILCILAILFVSMFALDAFDSKFSFWQQIGAFIIHLIPSFILTAILIIAWKRELIGGIILTIFGLVTTPLVFNLNYSRNHSVSLSMEIILMITFPFILTGILFIVNHYVHKKGNHLLDSHHLMHS